MSNTGISDDYKVTDRRILHLVAQKAGYKDEMPDIETFIDDPYYLGKSIGGNSLYPIWRQAAKEVFPSPYHSPYDEIILSGAVGLGKSTFSLLIQFYDLCRLLSLKNPQEHYKLTPSTVLSYAMLNATKTLAGRVLGSQFQNWLECSPYFTSKLDTSKKPNSLFVGNIDVVFGSRGNQFLGQATIGAIFSEINDMTVLSGQAEDNLDTIDIRRSSRFKDKKREILGHLILDSSSKGNRSFIQARIEEKEKKGIKGYKVFAFSHWEAKWHLGGYSGKFFKVYAGDSLIDPFIIEKEKEDLIPKLNPSRIIDVPVEHYENFNFNILKALRDLAGVSTFSSSAFISSTEVLNAAFNRPNPVSKQLIILDFYDKVQLTDFIDVKTLLFLSNKPRFIHIDLGLVSDSTGLACSYIDRFEQFVTYDAIKGKQVISTQPVFVNEFLMEIKCVPGQEVPIFKIKNFILQLKAMGMPISVVSTDGYQSTGLRQDLTLEKIKTQLISVDRTKDPYFHLRNAILEKRFSGAYSEKIVRELKQLEENLQKWDHPPDGSKDIADALCGSIWSAKENLEEDNELSVQRVDTLSNALTELSSKSTKFKNILLG